MRILKTNGEECFTAQIDDNVPEEQKQRKAVEWALGNNQRPLMADLSHADLSNMDLRRVCFKGADLSYADLSGALLNYADLKAANLSHANLKGANLLGANLSEADLSCANLDSVIVENTNFYGAEMRDADMRALITDTATVYIQKNTIKVGCMAYNADELLAMNAEQIEALHEDATRWWGIWKPVIKAIRESLRG
jgi:hypothetical protein